MTDKQEICALRQELAALKVQVARLEAELPSRIIDTMQRARERFIIRGGAR